MPRIFDNVDNDLRDRLTEILQDAYRADFCIGHFNQRGGISIDQYIEPWPGGEGNCCHLLVGLQRFYHEELRLTSCLDPAEAQFDLQTASNEWWYEGNNSRSKSIRTRNQSPRGIKSETSHSSVLIVGLAR